MSDSVEFSEKFSSETKVDEDNSKAPTQSRFKPIDSSGHVLDFRTLLPSSIVFLISFMLLDSKQRAISMGSI